VNERLPIEDELLRKLEAIVVEAFWEVFETWDAKRPDPPQLFALAACAVRETAILSDLTDLPHDLAPLRNSLAHLRSTVKEDLAT
jgi:hypothetical protein